MFWTVLAAYLGVTGGDTLWFLVCRKFGGRLVGTHWFRKQAHPKRILQVKALYDRHGTWVLLVIAVHSRFEDGGRRGRWIGASFVGRVPARRILHRGPERRLPARSRVRRSAGHVDEWSVALGHHRCRRPAGGHHPGDDHRVVATVQIGPCPNPPRPGIVATRAANQFQARWKDSRGHGLISRRVFPKSEMRDRRSVMLR